MMQKVDINLEVGDAKSRYQFISSSWGFLSMVTPWFVSNIGNASIRMQMSLKRIFKGFWSQVQNTYFVEHLSMVAYDNILWEKQYVIFQQILIPLEKTVYAPVYSLFEILSNENYFKQFIANSLYLIVRRVIRREGFTVNIYIEAVLINGAK